MPEVTSMGFLGTNPFHPNPFTGTFFFKKKKIKEQKPQNEQQQISQGHLL